VTEALILSNGAGIDTLIGVSLLARYQRLER
jgi:hypothetical protein